MNVHSNTKPYDKSFLNVCPSDDAGSARYTSPPKRYINYSMSTTPSSFSTNDSHAQHNSLQAVISRYQSNPELLRLILYSKVEEDRRRTEEAKLKSKELDMFMKSKPFQLRSEERANKDVLKGDRSYQYLKEPIIHSSRRRSSSTSSTGTTGSNTMTADTNIHNTMQERVSPYLLSTNSRNKPSASIPIDNNRRRHSTISTYLPISQLSIQGNTDDGNIPLPKPMNPISASAPTTSPMFLFPLSPPSADKMSLERSRRKRSIQAVTKIVETREFPYNDHYVWRNNGNTNQKKTGCRSTYHKCWNHHKGCMANKTVIEQVNGCYVIKYRGDHLSECTQCIEVLHIV
ncbi:hypothetical protein BDB01DRAFT_775511 [Pilobolus umbonatus]|nr:hypothetical protein BDB01DRAFT_775511 [Pilobolus umbonatus]